MLKAPSPLLGYNNNVRHKNRVFHIQTEDSGIKHPHIITHLFMDGGRILKSLKTSYAEHVGVEGMGEIVKQLMKEQHKAMFIALRDGQLDHLLEAALAPSKSAVPRASTPAPSPVSSDLPKSDIAAPPTLASGTLPAQPAPAAPVAPVASSPSGLSPSPGLASSPARPAASHLSNPALAAAAAALPPMRARAPVEDAPRAPLATIPDDSAATSREAAAEIEAARARAAPHLVTPPPARIGDLPPPPMNLQKPPPKPLGETRYRGTTRDDPSPSAPAATALTAAIPAVAPSHAHAIPAPAVAAVAAIATAGSTPAAASVTTGATDSPAAPAGKPKSVRPPRMAPKSQPRQPVATPPPVGASAAGRYAPARPAAIFGQSRPQQGSSIFGEDLISDKSLDEVILSYLAEDLETEKK